jgi:KDO2-lipid IV(A) lauroyltransferase
LVRHHRRLLPYYAFRMGQAVAAMLPRRVAHALARVGADVALRMRPRRYDGVRMNMRQVVPDASHDEIDRLVRENVRGLSCAWADVLQMRSRRRGMVRRLYTVGTDRLDRALERGHGAVIVSLHYGSWEMGLAAWAAQGHPMSVLAERLRPAALFDRMVAARTGLGLAVVPIDTNGMRTADAATARRLGAAAMRDVIRLLRNNGAIAIAIDRDLTGTGSRTEFLGAPATIPDGVVDVAIRCGAAILPTFLVVEGTRLRGEMHPEVPYDPLAPREQEIRRVTRELLDVCEGVIRRHPEQWHVLAPVWEMPA